MKQTKGRVSRRPGKGKGFRQAGASYRPALDAVAGKKGFAEADVLLRWPEIVGGLNLGPCRPQCVQFSRERTLGATLVIETTSARAAEVDHLRPVLLERVNQFYGYRAISRIRVVQTATIAGFAESQAGFEGPETDDSLVETHRATAAAMTEGIQSPGLRDALTRMGSHVLAGSNSLHKSKQN